MNAIPDLTEEQILAAIPDDLRTWTAKYVMGWYEDYNGFWMAPERSFSVAEAAWKPDEDIALCFHEIIPAMRKRGYLFTWNDNDDVEATGRAMFYKWDAESEDVIVDECTASPKGQEGIAICKAALLATLAEAKIEGIAV